MRLAELRFRGDRMARKVIEPHGAATLVADAVVVLPLTRRLVHDILKVARDLLTHLGADRARRHVLRLPRVSVARHHFRIGQRLHTCHEGLHLGLHARNAGIERVRDAHEVVYAARRILG